jgi:hypothetical protein
VSDLVAHDADEVIAVRLFGSLRDAPLEGKALRAIAAGGDDGARDDDPAPSVPRSRIVVKPAINVARK